MEGDQEKAKTLHKKKKKKKKTIAQAGRTKRFMGGDQTKNEGGYKKEQETVTRNIIASGAGGEDFEHFMRRIGKGSATAIVSAGEPPFCKCKVPLAECPASEFGHTCGRRFLPCPAWQDKPAICCLFKLCGCARRQEHSCWTDCASRIKCA